MIRIRIRLVLALLAAAVLCTWDGSVKTADCGQCSCRTSVGPTSHGPVNGIGRCSICGKPL